MMYFIYLIVTISMLVLISLFIPSAQKRETKSEDNTEI